MPIDPSIAMGVRPLEVGNPLNQLALASQIQASQRQGEVAQMQLEDLKNDRIEMAAFQRDTGLTTPQAIATLMRNPKTRGQAIELQMKYKQQLQADKFLRDRYPGLPGLFGEEGAAAPAAAPMAAPAAAAQIEPTGAQVGGPIAAPNVMAAPLTAPRNAMVAPAAAPAAAPANALAAPPTQGAASPTGRTRQELEYTIELAKMNPYLAGAGEVAKLELAELNKTQTLAPGTSLYQGGRVTFTAPAAPTTLARLQSEMAALPPGDPRRADYAALIKKETTHAPGTTVNVSTEKSYGSRFGGLLAERDAAKLDAADKAADLAESANRIIGLVQQGNVFTGPAADIKLNIARVLNVAGANNQEKIANTESLIAATGQSTLNAIKGAGLGTGQGFTDKDLRFLQGIAGGTIGLTQQTLTELARLQHQVAVKSAERWNKRVKELSPEVIKGASLSTEPIVVPPLAAPAPASRKPAAALPAVGTVQDGYRFKGGNPADAANWEKM